MNRLLPFQATNVKLYSEQDFYVLETVDSITFPTTYEAIQDGGTKKTDKLPGEDQGIIFGFKTTIKCIFTLFNFIEPMPVAEEGNQRQSAYKERYF